MKQTFSCTCGAVLPFIFWTATAVEGTAQLELQVRPAPSSATKLEVEIHNTGDDDARNLVVQLHLGTAGGLEVQRTVEDNVGDLPVGVSITKDIDAAGILPEGIGLSDANYVLEVKALGFASEKMEHRGFDPDLTMDSPHFVPGTVGKIKLQIVNAGHAGAAASALLLHVDGFEGVPIDKELRVDVPAVPAGTQHLLPIDAAGILPEGVALRDCTFQLRLDVDDRIRESNEENNVRDHHP